MPSDDASFNELLVGFRILQGGEDVFPDMFYFDQFAFQVIAGFVFAEAIGDGIELSHPHHHAFTGGIYAGDLAVDFLFFCFADARQPETGFQRCLGLVQIVHLRHHLIMDVHDRIIQCLVRAIFRFVVGIVLMVTFMLLLATGAENKNRKQYRINEQFHVVSSLNVNARKGVIFLRWQINYQHQEGTIL